MFLYQLSLAMMLLHIKQSRPHPHIPPLPARHTIMSVYTHLADVGGGCGGVGQVVLMLLGSFTARN